MIWQLAPVVILLAIAAWFARHRIAEFADEMRKPFVKAITKKKRPTARKKPAAKPAEPSGNPGELPAKKSAAGFALAAAAGAVVMWAFSGSPNPGPTPDPVPVEGLDLRGTFVGPHASTDAAALAALSEELAASVEWDAMQATPVITTGVSFDDLRIRMREVLMRGDSIGARQPKARDAVAAYLDEKCGNSGGPLTPAQRSAWVAAYRDVARASEAAYR